MLNAALSVNRWATVLENERSPARAGELSPFELLGVRSGERID